MTYSELEYRCEIEFRDAGPCWHIWTPENFEIIFTGDSDYKAGMTIVGMCAKLVPEIVILTFEIMSNHFHFTVCGSEQDICAFFSKLKSFLVAYFRKNGRKPAWNKFEEKHRLLENVEDARCVIAYDNRNGFVVSKEYTPFTYPWGANRYYFNPDAKRLALSESKVLGSRDKRMISRTSEAEDITNLLKFEECALPLSFCDISRGERFYRTPTHYFSKISRCIENNSKIAHEIGESIYYTDDDLYSAILEICKNKYSRKNPSLLTSEAKLEVAKTIRFEYNASAKQIQRMLKLDSAILSSIGIN